MDFKRRLITVVVAGCLCLAVAAAVSAESMKKATSYMPVAITEPFDSVMKRMKAAKPDIAKRHKALLEERYDLSDRSAKGVTM